ncbi:MAG TPA: lysine transporter LysE [Anaerolineales bacterium]|nr:lysine transporter LysE [Anaerolineae bacterium]HIQ00551.1 lysine transporter LysE [Anaerolineales bacterium]
MRGRGAHEGAFATRRRFALERTIGYVMLGAGYGFAAAVQPGPLQVYLVSQTLSSGWRRALPATLAPLLSDGPIIAVVLLLLSRVPDWLPRYLYIAGGLFLLYLAAKTVGVWRRFGTQDVEIEGTGRRALIRAALVNLLNPAPYLYWSLVTGPILVVGWRQGPANGIGFLVGFYATIIVTMGATVVVFGKAGELGARVNRALLGLSIVVLICFAVYDLWLGITGGRPV